MHASHLWPIRSLGSRGHDHNQVCLKMRNSGLGERMKATFLTQLNSSNLAVTQTQTFGLQCHVFQEKKKKTHEYKQVCVLSSGWYRVQYQQGIHEGYNGPGGFLGGMAQSWTSRGEAQNQRWASMMVHASLPVPLCGATAHLPQ